MKPFDAADLLGISEISVYLKQIEAGLTEATKTDNPALREPIARLVRAGSKRLRSVLVIAVASSQNKEIDDEVISGCVAIELIHIASLVHDDIIDHANTRWGIPTVNSHEGVNQAILVGDFLFAKAGEVGATINAEAASLVSSTIAKLVDGESREVADEYNTERTMDSLLTAIRGKTSALVSAACQMGGICAHFGTIEVQALARYGEAFGVAFQLTDDVLDFLSSEERLGKPVGNDVKEGVYTMPVLLALQSPHSDKIREVLKSDDVDHVALTKLIRESGSFAKTLDEARKYNKQATEALKNLPNSSRLANLPDMYLEWALSNLITQPIK